MFTETLNTQHPLGLVKLTGSNRGLYYANERMADSDKVTGQALITGAVSLAGMFSYLTGGLMVSAWGAMRGLLLVTLVGMAGGALFIFFAVKDQK